ncbi:hypothetical protein [Alteraurantiacibacter palmitatis]|uniref:Molecular chaperone n=1 Tax=Alteraurantiacibacter palmitatis TaxID=2054628 RepID=A0ABV7E8F8_9SPHN
MRLRRMAAALAPALLALPALAQDADELEMPAPPALAAAPEGAVGGMGDINLYPRRVVMADRSRTASVGVYNRTINAGEYEISIVDMVMASDGSVHQLDNLPPGVSVERLASASAMLRWSPRRVVLQGNEAQTVRIMARPPADLPDGEYRAHFMAVSIPADVDQGFSIEEAVSGGSGGPSNIGVTIRPRFGIAIPVIMRVGETTLEVGLTDLGLVQTADGPAISATITRSGTRSAFGDIVVTVPGSDVPVAMARGIGIYPEIDARPVLLALNPAFDRALLRPGTRLTLTYTDDDFAPGTVLARQEFTVP